MKEKPETVSKYHYEYKNNSEVIMGRVKENDVLANYKYNYLDVVYLNTDKLAIIIGFHPESDEEYLVEVCINKRVRLGREKWIYTEEYIDNTNNYIQEEFKSEYIVGKATIEETREVLVSFIKQLEGIAEYSKEVEEIKEKINSLGLFRAVVNLEGAYIN